MDNLKQNKSFLLGILINNIFIALITILLVLFIYWNIFKIVFSIWIINIAVIFALIAIMIGIYKLIMFIYRLAKKKKSVKGSKKLYLIIFCITLLISIITVCVDYNIQNKKSKQALTYIENYIVSNQLSSEQIDQQVDNYIITYKNSKTIKNDLVNFVIQETNLYENKQEMNQDILKDKLNPILLTLNFKFPENQGIKDAYNKLNNMSIDDINGNNDAKKSNSDNIDDADEDSKNTLEDNSQYNYSGININTIMPIIIILSPIIILNIVVANLIAKDCKKRNMNSINWWAVTFFFGLFAIILYAIVRDPRQDTLLK